MRIDLFFRRFSIDQERDMSHDRKFSRREVLKASGASALSLALQSRITHAAAFSYTGVAAAAVTEPTQDYAVVVGIQNYKRLSADPDAQLQGPVNDAKEFHEWLTAPLGIGGGVPPDNAALCIQPCKNEMDEEDRCPSADGIKRRFQRFEDIAVRNADKRLPEKIGRRLYIFLAGHGIEADDGPSLLCADTASSSTVRHIAGRSYAEWFFKAGWFDETILFMDCCRDDLWTTGSNSLPFDRRNRLTGSAERRKLFGYATAWNGRAREKNFDGKVHGIFSKILLDGLRQGLASDPDTDAITAKSLGDYLDLEMRKMVGVLPEIHGNRDPNWVLFPNIRARSYAISFQLLPTAVGKTIQVFATRSDNLIREYYRQQPPGTRFQLSLAAGLYVVQALKGNDAKQQAFQVPDKLMVTVE
jgi:hypothetical protein